MSNPSRVTAGIPTGGQFAATQRAESDIDLGAPETQSSGQREAALAYRNRYAPGGPAETEVRLPMDSDGVPTDRDAQDHPAKRRGFWQRRKDRQFDATYQSAQQSADTGTRDKGRPLAAEQPVPEEEDYHAMRVVPNPPARPGSYL